MRMTKKEILAMKSIERFQFLLDVLKTLVEFDRQVNGLHGDWIKACSVKYPTPENFLHEAKEVSVFDEQGNNVYPCGKTYKTGEPHIQHLEHCIFCTKTTGLLKKLKKIPPLDEFKEILGELKK